VRYRHQPSKQQDVHDEIQPPRRNHARHRWPSRYRS
jgi:hypothetical protein